MPLSIATHRRSPATLRRSTSVTSTRACQPHDHLPLRLVRPEDATAREQAESFSRVVDAVRQVVDGGDLPDLLLEERADLSKFFIGSL